MKYTYEYVKDYIESFNYVILSREYTHSLNKLDLICKNNHNFKLNFSDFKRGIRCSECSNCKKLTYEFVKKEVETAGFILNSTHYINVKTKLSLTCSNNHVFNTPYESFKRTKKCSKCSNIQKSINFTGKQNPNWNLNREHRTIKKRIRAFFGKNWIIKNMKTDNNYNNYINNSDLYQLDHIIPIDIFSDIINQFNLDETIVKSIINQRSNLQLILKVENRKKWNSGSLFEACQYLMLNGVKLY